MFRFGLLCLSYAHRAKRAKPPNETVEKHRFDRTYYTQTQDFNAQLGNNPIRQFDHYMAQLNAIRSSQFAVPNVWILPILCTRANNLHCTSTLTFERKVKRSNRF